MKEERVSNIEEEVKKYPQEKEYIEEYLDSLNETQWKGYIIAKQYLKTSFHLLKSNGYIEYKKHLLN
jgi:competence protein ComGC